jgi:LPXTG-motif cell wall-anchored protein
MLPNPVTKGCSNPSDGGGVPDVVNGKIVCPGGGTPNKITGICSVVPATSGGGAKPRPQPTPTPAPGPAAAGIDTNLLLIAGAVLVAGIGGMYIYKKNKAKRAGA